MIREAIITSVLLATGFFLIGISLGQDMAKVGAVSIFLAATPLVVACGLQFSVLRAIAQGKAQKALGGGSSASGEVLRAVIRPHSRPIIRPEPLQLPAPQQVRLVPHYTSAATAIIMPQEVKMSATEIVRTVPVAIPVLIDSADQRDLEAFIDGLNFRKHSRRAWQGVRLPSGRPCDEEYYRLLIAPLLKVGAIVGRDERRAGRLVMSPDEIKVRLGLTAPLPETTKTIIEAIPTA